MADKTCPQCGATYPYESELCPACGYQVEVPLPHPKKKPSIAALLSLFFFGAGQVYNGQIKKGIAFLVVTIIGIFIFIIPGVVVWAYGMYDAAVTATRMNNRTIQDIPTQRGRLALFIFIVLLIYVTVGVVFAAYADAVYVFRLPVA
jgi:TM2 domain-containing membrane protein YozV